MAQEAIILVYHRFGEDDIPATNIRLEQFEVQLDLLTGVGAHPISLEALIAARDKGVALPPNSVAITVDDAYESAAVQAWPRLKARGWPLAIFVSTDAVDEGRRGYLTWPALQALQNDGVTIGHHSAAHGHLAGMAPAAVAADLARANQRFDAVLGQVPQFFAYPYGEFTQALKAHVQASGFKAAFAQFSSVVSNLDDQFALPRFAINERYGAVDRMRTVVTAKALPLSAFRPSEPLSRDGMPGLALAPSADTPVRQIRCYAAHQADPITPRLEDGWLRVEPSQPFPPGRGRVNCTAPAGDGRYYWFGRPVFVPPWRD